MSFLGLFSRPWSIDPYRSYYIVFINININISNMVALVINSTIAGDVFGAFLTDFPLEILIENYQM